MHVSSKEFLDVQASEYNMGGGFTLKRILDTDMTKNIQSFFIIFLIALSFS